MIIFPSSKNMSWEYLCYNTPLQQLKQQQKVKETNRGVSSLQGIREHFCLCDRIVSL